ncbi:DUF4198 domain-containing protein [Flavobacterium daemonense]|uniref:DUF4198 domain-containing protein n=1 Tax=Flavobacterium daemonense TaxID=1393049 RepID=UPI0011847CC1|nr:DUF4198 domain-containing protein [Flavobacterium daemonense]KAF2331367.1 DUF4198 domain-containing protein [Flavobacterium daemonense]
MKKILLLIFTLLLSYSCEIQYDGETRIVVQGQLIDRNNNPLSDKKITITTYSDDTYGGSDLISYANTDAEGRFTLVFPAPKSEEIFIQTSINEHQNNGLQSKIINALKKNFNNYKLDLKQVVLYETKDISQLDILLNKVSTNKQITNIHIEGLQAGYFTDLTTEINQNQLLTTRFDVIKNQTINLSYTLVDYTDPIKTVTTNQKAVIEINSENVIHTITY